MKVNNTLYVLTALMFLTACGNAGRFQASEQLQSSTLDQAQFSESISADLAALDGSRNALSLAVAAESSAWEESYPFMLQFPADGTAPVSQFTGSATYYIKGPTLLTSGWKTYSFKVTKSGTSIQATDYIKKSVYEIVRPGLVGRVVQSLALPRVVGHLSMQNAEDICQGVFKAVLGYTNAAVMMDPKNLIGFDCRLTNSVSSKVLVGSVANQLHLFRVYGGRDCSRNGPIQLGDNFRVAETACTDPQSGMITAAGPNFKLMMGVKTLVFDK